MGVCEEPLEFIDICAPADALSSLSPLKMSNCHAIDTSRGNDSLLYGYLQPLRTVLALTG